MMSQQPFPFTAQYRDLLHQRVNDFDDNRRLSDELTAAAVAITIFPYNDACAVIVTRRSPRLNAHSGQWALPGGRVDPGESLIDAARREMHEEINLELPEAALLGTLDDYVTRSGYAITPVVFWADINVNQLTPNPDEVASIHPFSFKDLVRPDSPNLESIPESDRQVLSMNYEDDRIFAPTGAMLYQFREVAIFDKPTSVLHFDQPVFAWK
ncbi:MAG: 8-oxo-dGTP pyrophosphatase MutT (NUDIX family) [Candidatus Azotimanducaceae bacterium]|jgi:8-oxo-dGTP pyrophosphatase MutT (NUDIX family)